MALVELWVAVNGHGHGAIALTRQDALDGVAGSRHVAVGRVNCWALSAAMMRGGTLPLTFTLLDDAGRAFARGRR